MARKGKSSKRRDRESGPASFKRSAGITVAAVVLGAVLAFPGLGDNTLWEDEAETALFARNLLRFGDFYAWNGRNVIAFAGGSVLDENLRAGRLAPHAYVVAAAGITFFGDTPQGARALFVLAGILAAGITAVWARRFFDARFPWWLPAVLLVSSPAFLLYIRNARYYALGFFWLAVLLAVWCHHRESPASEGERRDRLRLLARHGIVVIAAAGLVLAQPVYAVGAVAALPLFFLLPRFRTGKQAALFGTIALASAAAAVFSLVASATATAGLLSVDDHSMSRVHNAAALFWWHLRDLGTSELFAWPVAIPLALPFFVERLKATRERAREALVLLLFAVAFLFFVAAISPDRVDENFIPSARYYVPVIVVGALIAAASLSILWRLNKAAAAVVALLLVGTNLFFVGPRHPLADKAAENRGVRCRLYDYVHQLRHPYDSAYDQLAQQLASLPSGTRILIQPDYASFPLMYSRPDLLFCDLLDPALPIKPELRAELPAHLFLGKSIPDVILIHPSSAGMTRMPTAMNLPRPEAPGQVARYRFVRFLEIPWGDTTRPEMRFHYFYPLPPDFSKPGFALYQPEKSPPPGPKADGDRE